MLLVAVNGKTSLQVLKTYQQKPLYKIMNSIFLMVLIIFPVAISRLELFILHLET